MINVQNISSKLAIMPDEALRQFAAMHKEDPYTFSLAMFESNRRKQVRSQPPPQMDQTKVVDKELADMRKELPENLGIARLPVDMNMASGGIVAFDEGGMTHYDKGGNIKSAGSDPKLAYRQYAIAQANKMGLDPALVDSIFQIESKYNPNAVSPKGAVGIGQLMPETSEARNLDRKDRTDPYRNIDVSLQEMKSLQAKYKNDTNKIAAAYNWGQGNLDKHLQKNDGTINTSELPKETQSYLKQLTDLIPLSSANAEVAAQPAKESSFRDLLPSFGDKVSDQTLSSLVTGKTKPAPQETGQTATFSGVGNALTTKEGLKRLGIGALEDSTIGLVGMPSDIGRTMPTSPVPVLRSLGTAADYLKRTFAPNAAADVGTTEYLKQQATKAGIRPEDSTDPNLRAIQTGGEFAGYLAHPIDAARALGSRGLKAIREANADLVAGEKTAGLGAVANKKAADAATAKQAADAATAKVAALRLEAPALTAPVVTKPRIAPVLREQPAAFPVSEEALRLKKQAAEAATARAAARPVTPEAPKGLQALAADRLAAEEAAKVAARMEKEAAAAKAEAEAGSSGLDAAAPVAARVKPANVSQRVWDEANASRVASRGASAATRPSKVLAAPGQVLARGTGKQDFPDITTGETPPNTRTSEDINEVQNLLKRYPAPTPVKPPEGGEVKPADVVSPVSPLAQIEDLNKGWGQRDAGGNLSPKAETAIATAAKDAVPKTEDNSGWSKDDWVQFGLALMAGKSSNALTNVGEAGLSLLASKQARELKNRELDLYKQVHMEKPGEREKAVQKLMDADKSLTYEQALSKYADLSTAMGDREKGVKQIMEERKVPYSKALEIYTDTIESPYKMEAIRQRAEAASSRNALGEAKLSETESEKNERLAFDRLTKFYAAKKDLNVEYPPALRTGSSASAKARQAEYEEALRDLQIAFKQVPAKAAPAVSGPLVKVTGVKP